MVDQEEYLKTVKLKEILKRGIRKLATEATSIKFLLLVFDCVGIWYGKISAEIGLSVALLLVGLREIPVDAIVAKLTGGKKEELNEKEGGA